MNDFEIDDGDAFDRLLVGSTIDSRLLKTTKIPIDLPKSRQDELSSDEDIVRTTHFKKTVFDDSSDDDLPLTFKKGILDSLDDDKISANDISDEEVGSRRKSAKRIKQLLDDSDDDDLPSVKAMFMSPSRNPAANTHQSPSTIINKSDDEHSDSDASIKSNVSSRSRKSKGCESGSPQSSGGEESNDETSIEAIKSKIMNKHKTAKTKLLSEPGSMDPEKKVKSKLSKEKAPSRKAKEAALAKIHSETQRMIRERQISLPYHKPKQRSLAEFLNRRKFAPTVRLKTTSDELAKVWQYAEEREKTAELFFKSDSDEESDKKDTSRVECVDVTTPQDAASNLKENLDETTTPLTAKPRIDSQSLISSSQPPDSEEFPRLQLSEILADTFDSSNANSPKIDEIIVERHDPKENGPNAKEIHSLGDYVPDAKEVTAVDAVGIIASSDSEPLVNSENVCHSSSILDERNSFSCLSEKINSLNIPIAKCPKISGAPDEVIDLDELATKPGAFGLMLRFLKHAKLKPKVKQQNTVSVISSEINDCSEIINLTEETIKVKNKDEKKPGERLTVLKTTLQQKIAENRRQQLAKRFEEYKLYEEEFNGGRTNESSAGLMSVDSLPNFGKNLNSNGAPKTPKKQETNIPQEDISFNGHLDVKLGLVSPAKTDVPSSLGRRVFTVKSSASRSSPSKVSKRKAKGSGGLAAIKVEPHDELLMPSPSKILRSTPKKEVLGEKVHEMLTRKRVRAYTMLTPTPSKDKKGRERREAELDPDILQRRQRQIDYGKNTLGYERYRQLVPSLDIPSDMSDCSSIDGSLPNTPVQEMKRLRSKRSSRRRSAQKLSSHPESDDGDGGCTPLSD